MFESSSEKDPENNQSIETARQNLLEKHPGKEVVVDALAAILQTLGRPKTEDMPEFEI